MILILIAIPADANFLNGYALNGSVLVGYVLKIRIGGICIGGIRLRFLLMHTFWMDTHWMDTHSMDTYWWDTCWTDTYWWDTYWWDTYCKTCWCKRFEWIRIAWIRTGGIRIGGIRFEWICVGYVWCDGYVWDMCGVMDMCGICVVWDMCGICVVWDTPTIFWRTLRRNVFREKLNGQPGHTVRLVLRSSFFSYSSTRTFVFLRQSPILPFFISLGLYVLACPQWHLLSYFASYTLSFYLNSLVEICMVHSPYNPFYPPPSLITTNTYDHKLAFLSQPIQLTPPGIWRRRGTYGRCSLWHLLRNHGLK